MRRRHGTGYFCQPELANSVFVQHEEWTHDRLDLLSYALPVLCRTKTHLYISDPVYLTRRSQYFCWKVKRVGDYG